jgi:hypothetical protein
MDLQRVQPALLSGVLIYDDEQNPFTDCILSLRVGVVLVKLALKTKKKPDYYLNKVTQKRLVQFIP